MDHWLPFLAEPGARPRLFVFPHAGAAAQTFIPWRSKLSSVHVEPLELPGRGTRLAEAPDWRMAPLVHDLIDAILPDLDHPFAFYGHSMGALIGYEVARVLADEGLPTPYVLAISGHEAPHQPRAPLRGHDSDDATFARELTAWGGARAEWLEDQELRALFFPVLRADFYALNDYVHASGPPLSCALHAFGGQGDPFVDAARLDVWSQRTTGSFTRTLFPGDHFFLLNTPEPFLAALDAALAR